MRLVRPHHAFYSTALAAHSRATRSGSTAISTSTTTVSSLSTQTVEVVSTSTPSTLVTSPSTTPTLIDLSIAVAVATLAQTSSSTTESLRTSTTDITTSLTTSIPLTTIVTPSPTTTTTPTSTCNTFVAAPISGPYANLFAQSNGGGNYLTLNGTSIESATRYVLNTTDGTINELNQIWQWNMNNLPQFAVYQDVDPVVALVALLINCSFGDEVVTRNGSAASGSSLNGLGIVVGRELLCSNVNGVGGFEACPVQLPDALIFGQGLGPTSDCVGFSLIAYPVC